MSQWSEIKQKIKIRSDLPLPTWTSQALDQAPGFHPFSFHLILLSEFL